MITDHEKFRLPDDSGKDKHLLIEVNWNPDDDKTNECKIFKLTYPDKTTSYVKREHFHAILFALSKPEDQMKMIPQTTKRVRWYESVVGVKATKDIRKGEMVNFPIKLSLPDMYEEKVGAVEQKSIIKPR